MTDNCDLDWHYSDMSGFKFTVPKCTRKAVQIREQSFNYTGPRLYNSIPLYLRTRTDTSFDTWKCKLDKFLETVPDNPNTSRITSGLCDMFSAKPSNSLLNWGPFLNLTGRRDRGLRIEN